MRSARAAIAALLFSAACAAPSGSQPSSTPAPAESASSPVATASAAATAAPLAHRALPSVPGQAIASPDGRWIAASAPPPTTKTPYEPALLLFSSDGALVRRVEGIYLWSWLPDSSGLYAATLVAQRAPDLHIVELDGRIVPTQIQYHGPLLSRDGGWIVAEHQEGCCVAIIQREIRVSSRDGRTVRTLVRSSSEEMHPIELLTIDAADRVLYRDGERILRVALAGGSPEQVMSAPDLTRTVATTPAPDGSAVLLFGFQPERWYVVANDRLTPWDATRGELVRDDSRQVLSGGPGLRWIGPHQLLVRESDGTVASHDAVTGSRSVFGARLVTSDVVLAHGGGALLVLRGRQPLRIELASGVTRAVALDVGTESDSVRATALPSGGFLLSTAGATFRVD